MPLFFPENALFQREKPKNNAKREKKVRFFLFILKKYLILQRFIRIGLLSITLFEGMMVSDRHYGNMCIVDRHILNNYNKHY